MKELRERLRRLEPRAAPQRRRRRVSVEQLSERLGDFERLPGGAFRRVLPLRDLPAPAQLNAGAWRLLAGVNERPRLPWLVFDCETTGLESGAGNLVFLLGWVEWKSRGSRAVQIFLPDPSSENEMLDAFETAVRGAGGLLSYNGKSFDLPRLRSRVTLQRRVFGAEGLPHMDLVHPCRRLARDWLEDGRLCTMERAFLGKERKDDLPGSEVPEAYRRFLAGDLEAPIGQIIEHNRRDIVHLCELANALAGLSGDSSSLPASARLQLARLQEARGDSSAARQGYDAVALGGGEFAGSALWHGALLAKRGNDHAAARSALERMLECEPSSVHARVELAKLLEHHFSAPAEARRLVLEALDVLEAAELAAKQTKSQRREARRSLHHRLSRLERKCTGWV